MLARVTVALCIMGSMLCCGADDGVCIVFEAESARDVSGVIEFAGEEGMSGGIGLRVREGCGADLDEKQSDQLHHKYPRVHFGNTPGRASYRFHVPRSDDYYVWARVFWFWECSNSFWIGDPGVGGNMLTDKVYHRWHWVRAQRSVRLESGTNDFSISNREDGMRVDQFCLTNDPGFTPQGELAANALIPRDPVEPPVALFAVPLTPLAFPHMDTPGVLWLRNAAGRHRSVSVTVSSDEGLAVSLTGADRAELIPRDGIVGLPFVLRRTGGLALRNATARFAAHWGDQGEESTGVVTVQLAPIWQVAGPFHDGSIAASLSPAVLGKPGSEAPTGIESLTWKPIDDPALFTGSGRVNLKEIFPQVRSGCWAYLRADVSRPRNELVSVELRSDDQSVVWVNAKRVGEHPVVGPTERYSTHLSLPLATGSNTLVVAVHQVKAFWEMSLRPLPD